MILTVIPTGQLSDGKLVYVPSDFSFDTINRRISSVTSLLVNYINVDFSVDRKAVAIWGLCPQSSWRQGCVTSPDSQSGELQLQEDLTPGVSIRITRLGEYWPVTYDLSSGWLCVRQEKIMPDQAVEFVAGCVVGLQKEKICGLWLYPEFQT